MRAHWAWAAVAAAVLAAGCSTDPGHPTTLPTLTATTTPSPTPSTTDLEAAKAVVQRYFTLLNAATTSANADALAQLMTTACKCQDIVSSTREVASRHQHYFGEIRLTSVIPAIDGQTSADVLVHYNYTASGVADSTGHVVRSSPGRVGVGVDFRLIRNNATWLITQIVAVSAGRVR